MSRETSLSVRRAVPGDAQGIADVYVESWRETYAGILPTSYLVKLSAERLSRQWRYRLSGAGRGRRGPYAILVAETAEGLVVGFGESGPSRESDLGYAGEIYTLYVAPDYLSLGVGRALLAALFSAVVESGTNTALIWALTANPSRHFYAANGGRIVAERSSVYWGRQLREIAYGWSDLEGWLSDASQPLSSGKDA